MIKISDQINFIKENLIHPLFKIKENCSNVHFRAELLCFIFIDIVVSFKLHYCEDLVNFFR